MIPEKHMIELCGKSIEYELCRKKVKNINLRINESGIHVSAKRNVSLELIEGFMHDNARFIIKAAERMEAVRTRNPRLKDYSDGEEFTFFGERRRLHIIYMKESSGCVDDGTRITVCAENMHAVKKITDEYLVSQLTAETDEQLRSAWEKYRDRVAVFPKIRYRRMKSCHGSCMKAKNVITFNKSLAYVPRECIKYVVYHELTHLIYADHSEKFYAALSERLPEWKILKAKLSQYG